MTSAFDAGMAVCALLWGDTDGGEAEAGLSPVLAERLRARAARLAETKKASRTAALLDAGRDMRAEASPSRAEPRRVLAVLASEVDRRRGELWLAAVPGHRGGWSAPAELRALLVRSTHHEAGERSSRELADLEAASWPV